MLISLLSACSSKHKKEEDQFEKLKAINLIKEFYANLHEQKYHKTYRLYSPDFLKKIDTTTIKNIYEALEIKAGNVDSISKIDCEIDCEEGTNKSCTYIISCLVKRSQYVTKERFTLNSVGESSPTITVYALDGIIR
ncbi:hypothetical protein D9M68_728790 [compost metagenome]